MEILSYFNFSSKDSKKHLLFITSYIKTRVNSMYSGISVYKISTLNH